MLKQVIAMVAAVIVYFLIAGAEICGATSLSFDAPSLPVASDVVTLGILAAVLLIAVWVLSGGKDND